MGKNPNEIQSIYEEFFGITRPKFKILQDLEIFFYPEFIRLILDYDVD